MQKGSMSPEFREPHRHGDPVVADERGVVWIAPPHDHDASVPSPARASARFGGLLVPASSQPRSGSVGCRAKSARFGACWFAPIRFLERARPVPDIGGARSTWASSPASVHCRATAASMNWAFSGWLRWLCPLGGGLVVYQAGPGIEVWGASRWPAADIPPGGRRGESAGPHGVCAQRARPLPFVWYDLLGLTEPRCGRARAADARSPGGVAHGPGPAADTTGSWRRGCRSVRFDGGGWWRPPRWRGPLGVGPPRPRFGA